VATDQRSPAVTDRRLSSPSLNLGVIALEQPADKLHVLASNCRVELVRLMLIRELPVRSSDEELT
jgi:hypothetical protein